MNMSSGDISKGICRRFFQHPNTINQESPTFLAPGTVFMEDNISMDWRVWEWFWDDSCTLHLLCPLLLLNQLHLRSSGIRSQRSRTPAVNNPNIHQQ